MSHVTKNKKKKKTNGLCLSIHNWQCLPAGDNDEKSYSIRTWEEWGGKGKSDLLQLFVIIDDHHGLKFNPAIQGKICPKVTNLVHFRSRVGGIRK